MKFDQVRACFNSVGFSIILCGNNISGFHCGRCLCVFLPILMCEIDCVVFCVEFSFVKFLCENCVCCFDYIIV